MVQLNFAWHIYMKAFCPSVRAMSFVDNLALAAAVPALLAQGLACLVEFFRLWNLVLDHNKSYCWALADDMRARLRTLPFTMVTSARELGGVLSFTRKQFTGQQATEFLALESRWHTLIPVVFWSSALHGIYGSCLGETWRDPFGETTRQSADSFEVETCLGESTAAACTFSSTRS